MDLGFLKPVRVAVSIIFFIAVTLFFIDIWQILPAGISGHFTYLQFTPSLLKFIALPALGTIGFAVILVLTVLFGRIYCSSVCPVGTLQDFISWISRKTYLKKRGYIFSKPHNILRYSILALTILVFVAGNIVLINLLDPYSNFGRLLHDIIKPILIYSNNSLAFNLQQNNVYWFELITYKEVQLVVLIFPVIFLLTILYMSFMHGRLYCNTVCPVGSLLGLISKFSIFKIKIDERNCSVCGSCEQYCKAGCIDKVNQTVDMSRCINCYNCFNVCPGNAFEYNKEFSPKLELKIIRTTDYKRRFLLFSPAFLLAAVKVPKPLKNSTIKENKLNPSSPPGSVSLSRFKNNCTACHLCVSVCPTHVLQPSIFEYGITGILQPVMDYRSGFCNYDCIDCSLVCPTGAILPVDVKKKHFLQIGIAKLIKDNCVVFSEEKDCGACSEHCPTKAVDMVPYKNNLMAPQVTEKYCVGCGACENICPTKPFKAIYVTGNTIHKTAQENKSKKLDKKIDYKEDFPF